MTLSNDLKLKLEKQKAARISKEAPVDKLLHTIYLGDRTIQQLGQKPIANGIKLNNAAVEIGDPMLPLAKGDVLRRVDNKNRNGGKALGSAQRTALERDGLANKRSNGLGDNGDIAPTNNPNDGSPKKPPKGFDPPFGCEPPVKNCLWLNTAIAPNGYVGFGSVVLNNDGLELYLYCTLGTTPPPDLGCDFNRAPKWKCVNGVCVQDANGVYASLSACNAARVRNPPFGISPDSIVGWYVQLTFELPFNNPSPNQGLTTFAFFGGTSNESDALSLGANCDQGGRIYLINGISQGCFSDNIQNQLLSGQFAFYRGYQCP